MNIAYIGCGTQGIREMVSLIEQPDVQITSVCDPNKYSTNYVDWSPHGIRNMIRRVLDADDKELPGERMMFVGDKGKILASFHGARCFKVYCN